ncbi:MAG: hypothetical protein ABIR57_15690 [Aeromicrobium sp.]
MSQSNQIPQIVFDAEGVWLETPSFGAEDNRQWLSTYTGWTKGTWNPSRNAWKIPYTWFEVVIDACVLRFGGVMVTRTHKTTVACTWQCRNAKREKCECSCLGQFHKAGLDATDRAGWQLGNEVIITEDLREVTWLVTARNNTAQPIEPKSDAQWERFDRAGGYWEPH